jgi:type IV pilus assembly protein PilC
VATFTFIAYDAEGRQVRGAKKFMSQNQMEDYLTRQQCSHFEIFPSETAYKTGAFALVSPKELSIFCRQMSVLFFSHITLMEGLLLLASQTDNKQLKISLREIYERMKESHTFGESMGMYHHIFGSYLLNMITIGETSGALDSVFIRMSAYFEKESKIRKKLKAAVTYPSILTVLMGAIVLLLILKILPMFQSTLATLGGETPASTKVIFAAANFIRRYIALIVAAAALIVAAAVLLPHSRKGRYWLDKMKVKVPMSKFLHVRVITTRFSRSLAILLKSGVQLLNAMEEIIVLIDNHYLEDQFKNAFLKVKEGQNLADVLSGIDVFPPLFLRMVAIGDSTGHLDEMLEKSASVFDDEVDEAIERITMMVEPALIIVLSVVVGIILLSVMLPMINIMNAIG